MTFTTLNSAVSMLSKADPDMPIRFQTDEGQVKGDYHLTEIMRADVATLDCGVNNHAWSEIRVQLMDGYSDNHMPAGKLLDIVRAASERLPNSEGLPITIEFSHENKGLRLYRPSKTQTMEDHIAVTLAPKTGQCKAISQSNPASSCC